MAEDNGGTSEGAPGTFTQADVDAAVAKAREEQAASTKTEVFTTAQSVADKQIAEIRKTATDAVAAAQSALSGVTAEQEAAKVAGMSPDERTAHYLAKLVEQGGAKATVPASTSPSSSEATETPQTAEAQARSILEETTTKLGLKKEDLDFDSGSEGFIKSVIKASAVSNMTDEQKAEAAKLAEEKERLENPGGPGGSQTGLTNQNLLTMTPAEIIRGAKTESPWKPK